MRTLLCDKITGYRFRPLPVRCYAGANRRGAASRFVDDRLGLFFIFLDGFCATPYSARINSASLSIDILYDPWVCSDGSVIISLGSYDIQKRFLTAIDMEHLLEDPRFDTFETRYAHPRVKGDSRATL